VSDSWYPAPARTLLARGKELQLGSRPWLMGIVNASPESFSDGGRRTTLGEQARLAEQLLAAGADILDIGGESARTDIAPIDAEREIERVAPLVELAAGELGAVVSVDTHKPAVARAAIAAGAAIVNDVSGLRNAAMARLCAQTGAALVVMHTLAAPGRRLQAADTYADIVAEVCAFLRGRIDAALAAGVRFEQLIVDPGPDFAKTPSQSIALLRGVGALHELRRPLLMAVSRKDFIGALTQRAPRDRLAGTLAALAHGVACGAHIFRVHDVSAVADFLTVSAALAGESAVPHGVALPEELRYDRLARPLG
jgi:dihydropteroate synthase